jgi:hypothetical protein
MDMHQLEPGFWSITLASRLAVAPRHAARREAHQRARGATARVGSPSSRTAPSIRAAFRLIQAFHRGCAQSAPGAVLAATVKSALELARIDFALLARETCSSAQFRSDCDRCLVDLEGLVAALSSGVGFAPGQLAHALDTLAVLLVLVDAANRSEAG